MISLARRVIQHPFFPLGRSFLTRSVTKSCPLCFVEHTFGLNNLATVGGDFDISLNTALSSLNGLNSLTTVGFFFEISDNPALSICATAGICAYLDNGGTADFENNLNGCNSLAQVQNACGSGGRPQGFVVSNSDWKSAQMGAEDRMGGNLSKQVEMTVFPNPTTGTFTVSIQDGVSGQARLLDLTGRILAKQKMTQSTLFDLSSQPAGVYWVDIRFDDGTRHRKKLIKE